MAIVIAEMGRSLKPTGNRPSPDALSLMIRGLSGLEARDTIFQLDNQGGKYYILLFRVEAATIPQHNT